MDGPVRDELIALEERGWQALSQVGGAEFYDDLLTEDAVMVFPGAGVLDRAASLAGITQAPPWSWFRMHDASVLPLGEDAAVVHYRVEAQREGAPTYEAYLASVYVRRDGRWRLAFHQHSPDSPHPRNQ